MKIEKVTITPIKPFKGLIAFAHLFIEGGLYLGSIGVYTKRDGSGYRLTYPTRKVGDVNISIFHPTTQKCSKEFEKMILEEVSRIFETLTT